MTEFRYTALTQAGKTVKGKVVASAHTTAVQQLVEQQLYPLDVQETKTRFGKTALWNKDLFFHKRLTLKEQYDIVQRMYVLLESGLPLEDILELLVEQGGSAGQRKALHTVLMLVREGESLSESISKAGMLADSSIAAIRSGEASGNLLEIVGSLSTQLQRRVQLSGKVRSALAYPAFLLLFCGAVVCVLLSVVVPQLTDIFMNMEKTLPVSTRVLIGMSEWLAHWGWVLPILAVAAGAGIVMALKNPKGRFTVHSVILRIPLWGNIYRLRIIASFSNVMQVLLRSGVPLLSALRVAAESGGSAVLEKQLTAVDEGLKAGGTLVRLLETRIFSAQDIRILDAGERSGQLDAMFGHVAYAAETELERVLRIVISLLEPVLILIMGSIVGFVVLAIFLPILEMSQL